MPGNTRKIKLVGSSAWGITSAAFETQLGVHECERVARSGFFGGGDYVLECDQLPTERPIVRIHVRTPKGNYTCEVPPGAQREWYVEIRA